MRKLLIFMAVWGISLTSCAKKEAAENENVFYTCSMHPQVMQDKPGTCPICRMDLVRVEKNIPGGGPGLKISPEGRTLAGIRVAPAEKRILALEKSVLARIAPDPGNVRTVTARLAGRVERLYAKYEGEKVNAGQWLYDFYSEALSSEVLKFHLLPRSEPEYESLLKSARNKFALWGLPEEILHSFDSTGLPEALPIMAPFSGVILSAEVREGDYVAAGAVLFRLADLSKVWAEAEFYESEAGEISQFENVEMSLDGNLWVPGKIIQIDGGITAPSRKLLVRVSVDNPDRRFRPGTPATARFRAGKREVLAVPAEALLRDSRGAVVFIENENGNFEERRVETGIEAAGWVEIKSGLAAGDKVAVSGAYLLQSEQIFKHGSDPGAENHNQ